MHLGVDIGGTKALFVALDDSGVEQARRVEPRPRSAPEIVASIAAAVGEFEEQLGAAASSVGIGIAGAVARDGVVAYSPNLPEIVDFALRDELETRLERTVTVDNDATAATWAEFVVGAGRGTKDLLYVALGTGIGTGFVIDGQIVRGAHGMAGEAGHMVIDRNGATHVTGVRGPWELVASGSGFGALAARWAHEGRLPDVVDEVGSAEDVRGEHVSAAYAAGSAHAEVLVDVFADDVAVGLTNLLYILDPAVIVIGGGLVELGERLRHTVQQKVDATTLGRAHRADVPIRLAELGVASAAVGAALIARDG